MGTTDGNLPMLIFIFIIQDCPSLLILVLIHYLFILKLIRIQQSMFNHHAAGRQCQWSLTLKQSQSVGWMTPSKWFESILRRVASGNEAEYG